MPSNFSMRPQLLWLLAATALCIRPNAPLCAAEAEDSAAAKRPSFFSRMFGGRTREPESPQSNNSTAKKTPSTPAQRQESAPSSEPKGDAKLEPRSETKNPPKKAAPKDKAPEAPKSEEERFEAARKTAAEDSRIAELRTKAEASPNNAESNRLMRSYLRSLYGKMRSLEPGLSERIDLTEKAALKLVPEPQ